jgi:hypothetical protein
VPSWGGAGGGHGSGWGATSLPPEQASHPFAAEVHAVLATEPGPDLAIPFSGEGCGVQDLADQLDQVAIADRGGRTGPATGTGCGAAGRRGWSAARRAPGTPRPLVAGRPWLAGPLRRRDLQPPFCSAAAPRIAFSMVGCPTLRSACRNARSSPDRSGRCPSGLPYRSAGSRRARRPADGPRPEFTRQRLQRLAAQQPEHCVHLLAG